jgi:UDP-glucuronate 4-epimerase
MKALVTGAAGFIGSTLTDRLLSLGMSVVAIDSFTPHYSREIKRNNLATARKHPLFQLAEVDLMTGDLAKLVWDVDVIFHLAGQPGVRDSWRDGFVSYLRSNVAATQRLLEACTAARPPVIYASSSSVYGQAPAYPASEDMLPAPQSPYGVTKLSGEHLCTAYASNWNIPVTILRLFTVYGPRQRPDMAIARAIQAALVGSTFELFGDGTQVRDFTYVDDVVDAFLLAAEGPKSGAVHNVAGGSSTTMLDVIGKVELFTKRPVMVLAADTQPGDVPETGGSIVSAEKALGWTPKVALDEGIQRQVLWHAVP